jgi:leucyl-tRNA---protein transferase
LKLNARFRIEIQVAAIDSRKEALYARYKKSVSFNASSSLRTLLFGSSINNIFNSQEINIYDEDRLIASGLFDVGKHSAAGITCFYDPHYKRYSLGKYLMFLKLDYCKKQGLQFFYPGYFVPGYKAFDYKLKIGKPAIEFLETASNQWMPATQFSSSMVPIEVMQEKLRDLRKILSRMHLRSRILKYEFFDANIIPDLSGIILFDFPVFLTVGNTGGSISPVVVFDIRDNKYHLLKCISLWRSNLPDDLSDIFSSDLLKVTDEQFASPSPEELADRLSVVLDTSDLNEQSTSA